jgi:hypothetical protein
MRLLRLQPVCAYNGAACIPARRPSARGGPVRLLLGGEDSPADWFQVSACGFALGWVLDHRARAQAAACYFSFFSIPSTWAASTRRRRSVSSLPWFLSIKRAARA